MTEIDNNCFRRSDERNSVPRHGRSRRAALDRTRNPRTSDPLNVTVAAPAVHSPKRQLKWFTAREGGVEHVSADNMPAATGYIADWIHDTL